MPASFFTPPARLRLPLLVLATALGCTDSQEPTRPSGAFALQRVGSDALPAVVFTSDDVSLRTIADTLRVDPGGTGTRIIVGDYTPANGPRSEPTRSEGPFTYQIIDNTISIAFDCPPNANCVEPPHLIGRFSPLTLAITFALGQRVPQYYAQVP